MRKLSMPDASTLHAGISLPDDGGDPEDAQNSSAQNSSCAGAVRKRRISPMIKPRVAATVVTFLLIVGGAATAQPKRNVSGARHPNLAAAQRLSQQAWNRIVQAQQANEFDMQGHAQKAKELLDQANKELKLAAEMANRNAK